jgi:hypothetical protein
LTRCGSRFLAQATAGLVFGAALALLVLTAALVFLALAGFGRFAILGLGSLALSAASSFLGLTLAIFLVATAGIDKGVHAGIALLIGERLQHHTGPGRVRGRAGTLRASTL